MKCSYTMYEHSEFNKELESIKKGPKRDEEYNNLKNTLEEILEIR